MKVFKILATLLIFFSLQSQLTAQKSAERFSLSGNITSSTGAPLAGASVYISDIRKGSVADDKGNYRLNNIPSGSFLVEI
ncbi:MAG TPA: carboxypeptidase-like regulatory domain-containing protein, partial [Hanamia sp.]|nr:carboxypeptidase-like regulatory domain-containing protein [Hanamia sp.]